MSNITRKRGDTYADELTITSSSTGLPVNITGYSFLLTVDTRQNPTDETTQVYQLTGAIISGVNGRVEFAPSDAQADHVGDYYYDVQMLDGAGRKRTIASGKYKYTQDITKD